MFTCEYTDDEKKIKDYLFSLNMQLRYMFSNIDPEENFADPDLNYIRQDESFSIIEAGAKKISWILSDGESESSFSLSSRMAELLSENVKVEGLVKFTDLEKEGSSIINGANITTGTLKADRISGGTLKATTLSGGTITGTTINGAKITGTTITAGTTKGNSYVGGVLSIANRLYADSTRTRIGDFFVSFNRAYNFKSIKGTFVIDAGEVSCTSVTTTGTGATYSDRRLKENIEDISLEQAEHFIAKLRPVIYERIDTGEQEVGLIAQEVEERLKEEGVKWSLLGEHGGYKMIAYESFIPLITAAIKRKAGI